MATFEAKYAHDVLIPIAEAAYLPNLQPNPLPPDYSAVGPIVTDDGKVAALAAVPALAKQLDLVKRMQAGGGFGWVVQNTKDHTLVVSFRGTADPTDWLHDFDCLPAAYEPVANYGTVHKGFQEVYKVVRDSVFSLIAKADKGFTRLILTGHSLGAALSELAAPDLVHNADFTVLPEVQNFAGPRAGHRDFASIFDVEIDICFRVVNLWDLVPHVPPPLALFEHVGLAVKVDGGFTLDELVAHSMERSYGPALTKLPDADTELKAASVAAANMGTDMMVGREP